MNRTRASQEAKREWRERKEAALLSRPLTCSTQRKWKWAIVASQAFNPLTEEQLAKLPSIKMRGMRIVGELDWPGILAELEKTTPENSHNQNRSTK